MLKLLMAGIVALVALVGYCGDREENPITGEAQRVALSAEQEVALGRQAAPELAQRHGGPEPDPEAQTLVDQLGRRIVERTVVRDAPYRFEFHVLDDDRTLNAFALPGGQVFITDALLDRLGSEEQIAAVLAHEVAHVVARHGAEHLAKQELVQGLADATTIATYDPGSPGSAATGAIAAAVGQLVTMRFSREDEIEADRLGVRVTREVDVADPVARGAQHRVEHAQRLGGDVLEDEDSGHGRRINDRPGAAFGSVTGRGPAPATRRWDWSAWRNRSSRSPTYSGSRIRSRRDGEGSARFGRRTARASEDPVAARWPRPGP